MMPFDLGRIAHEVIVQDESRTADIASQGSDIEIRPSSRIVCIILERSLSIFGHDSSRNSRSLPVLADHLVFLFSEAAALAKYSHPFAAAIRHTRCPSHGPVGPILWRMPRHASPWHCQRICTRSAPSIPLVDLPGLNRWDNCLGES
jgi:hypothetical protein